MVLPSLSTPHKVALLSILVVIAVVAVVIPILTVRGSSTPTNIQTDMIQVLRTVKTELENLKIKINNNLNKTETPQEKNSLAVIPFSNLENNPAAISVDAPAQARQKRQALPDVTTDTASTAGVEDTNTVTSVGTVGSTASQEQAETSTENTSVVSAPSALNNTMVNGGNKVERFVDELSEVLDVLTKTEHDMVSGVVNSVDTGLELSNKIHARADQIINITIDTPAGKQLVRDMLAKVENAEDDVIKTIGLIENIQTLKVSLHK